MDDARPHDAISAALLLLGFCQGAVPFLVKLLAGDAQPLLALPLRLSAPWWWIVSGLTIVATVVLLEATDRAKQRSRRRTRL